MTVHLVWALILSLSGSVMNQHYNIIKKIFLNKFDIMLFRAGSSIQSKQQLNHNFVFSRPITFNILRIELFSTSFSFAKEIPKFIKHLKVKVTLNKMPTAYKIT